MLQYFENGLTTRFDREWLAQSSTLFVRIILRGVLPVSPSTASRKTAQQTQEYTEILSRFHLALKNIQIYPPGHNLLQTKLAAAHQSLTRALIKKNNIRFGIARDTFTYAGSPVGEGSKACAAFAKILTRHEIASISFSEGITQHSLFLFLKTVGILPEQQGIGENRLQDISSLNIPHLQVEFIDYTYFARNVTGEDSGAPLTWMTFAQKLAGGTLGHFAGATTTDPQTKPIAPKTLAATINKEMGNHPQILQQFSGLLDQLLQQTTQQQSATSFGGQELSQILSSLNPDLRKQFFDTTLKQCDKNLTTGNTKKILDEFSDSVVLDMLQQVNREQTTISPALLNLIHKLSGMNFATERPSPASITRQCETGNLLKEKNYTQQVSPAYQDSLQHLSRHSSAPSTAPADFPLGEHLESMKETQLDKKIIQAILIFMGTTIQDQEYKKLARKLMELSLLLPDYGAFDLLQTIVRQLQQQAADKTTDIQKGIAQECIRDLASPDFIDYIFSILPDATATERKDGIDFLLLLGPETLDSILTIYCIKTKIPANDPMVIILKASRVETLTRLFPLLRKATPVHALKLLLLLEYLGIQGTVRLLHPLLDHENSDIRNRVLGLLLPSHDQQATATLNAMLQANNEPTVNMALELCDTYRPKACVTTLTALLEHKLVTRAAIEKNRQLIQVLGHIGDPEALPHLEKLAFGNWLFLRQEIADMKRLIFYSLKDYHPEDSRRLLLKGSKTKDEKTVTICSTILNSQQRRKIKK